MESNEQILASEEMIDSLIDTMKRTMEGMYHELFIDMGLNEALRKRLLKEQLNDEESLFVEELVKVHSHVCYAILCLGVQCRASLKSTTGVEKQYNIRRSVVTGHEIYKYLYGFTGKTTPWLKIEAELKKKYSNECNAIAVAAGKFKEKFAQDADGTLRDVAKHYSDEPTEFFHNMMQVTEKNVTDRVSAALCYLVPMQNLLVCELKSQLGELYDVAANAPMPKQQFQLTGIEEPEKNDALTEGIEKYGGIVNNVMQQLDTAEKIGQQYNFDLGSNTYWKGFVEDNVGLHILYIYLDSMSTFRSFTRSETFAEYRQNLAYLIVSVHEGFKKLYGFDDSKRDKTFWHRSIRKYLLQVGDDPLKAKMSDLEVRLEQLSKSNLLSDEDMVVAFTHVGTIKKLGKESSFAVLDYFRQPVDPTDLKPLTDFLQVMNDIVRLYNKVVDAQNKVMKESTEAKYTDYRSKIDQMFSKLEENVKDPEQIEKLREMANKIKEVIDKFEHLFD